MIVFTGDWHGEYDRAYRKIKALDLRDCVIIQVGDFGIGFERRKKDLRKLDILNKQLVNRNIILYAIRGNHDDPIYFDGSINLSNLKLLKDYTVLDIEGVKILCVGGAISIDRKPNPDVVDAYGRKYKGRTEGTNYWSNEAFVFQNVDLVNIDIVVTHTAPDFAPPYTKYGMEKWIKHDPELSELVDKERSELTILYEQLKKTNNIGHWFYGHFHSSNTDYTDNTKFVLLNEHEFFELR